MRQSWGTLLLLSPACTGASEDCFYLKQDLYTLWLAGDGGQMEGGASWKERKREGGWVGGPMNADDSLGGKARDAQIIRGRLEREALGCI